MKLGSRQVAVLQMMNPEWVSSVPGKPDAESLRVLESLEVRALVHRNFNRWTITAVGRAALALGVDTPAAAQPLDMVLHCPKCHAQHVDEPDERTPGWANPPHRSHLCHDCKTIWRPADVPTNGVRAVKTRGKADTWPDGVQGQCPACHVEGGQHQRGCRNANGVRSVETANCHRARMGNERCAHFCGAMQCSTAGVQLPAPCPHTTGRRAGDDEDGAYWWCPKCGALEGPHGWTLPTADGVRATDALQRNLNANTQPHSSELSRMEAGKGSAPDQRNGRDVRLPADDEARTARCDAAPCRSGAGERSISGRLQPQPVAAEIAALLPRIDAAIQRITTGSAPMRVPAEPTDPDLVLADCKRLLSHAHGVCSVPAIKPDVAQAMAAEYQELMAHMDSGGDYFEFVAKRTHAVGAEGAKQ